jgi:hypothetical protein
VQPQVLKIEVVEPSPQDFIANGGGFSSYFVDEAAFKKHLERFYTSKGIDFRTVLDSPSKLPYAVERIADAFEMATRLCEFRRAPAQEQHPRHAAYLAREVSTDFAMRGDWAPIGYAYDTIIFLKAAVNGIDRPIKGERLLDLQPWARSSPYTSQTLRRLGEVSRDLPRGMQPVPVQVEALLRGYFNTWAMYGLTLSDAMFFDDSPSLRIDQYPGIRRFYRATAGRTRYVTEFYEMVKEATEARRIMKHMARRYQPEITEELAHSPANLEYGQLSRASKGMQRLGGVTRRVLATSDLATLQDLASRMAEDRRLEPKVKKILAQQIREQPGRPEARSPGPPAGRAEQVGEDRCAKREGPSGVGGGAMRQIPLFAGLRPLHPQEQT